jgi:hypothetical protein
VLLVWVCLIHAFIRYIRYIRYARWKRQADRQVGGCVCGQVRVGIGADSQTCKRYPGKYTARQTGRQAGRLGGCAQGSDHVVQVHTHAC